MDIPKGTLFPKPKCYNIPIVEANQSFLFKYANNHAPIEVCEHLLIHNNNEIFLEWYDFSFDPFSVSGKVSRDQINLFCKQINAKNMEFIEKK